MLKVIKWFPAEELKSFLATIREGTKAVIAVRLKDGCFAVHFDYNLYSAGGHALEWHLKLRDTANIYINDELYFGYERKNCEQGNKSHKAKVFEMLKKQKGICFKGGLESSLVNDEFIEGITSLRIKEL